MARPVRQARAEARGTINALKVEIASLHERIRRLTAELDEAHKRIAELEAQ